MTWPLVAVKSVTLEVVVGTRGPVPKRSDQRRRENKPEIPIESAPSTGAVEVPAVPKDWHPIARMWFESHGKSGQHIWFQPSDWAEAFLLAYWIDEALQAGQVNGQKLAAIMQGSARLMTTEADRRRLRIELERPNRSDEDEDAAVLKIADYQSRLG